MAFFETYSIKIVQPLGEFFLTKIPAEILRKVSFVEEMMYVDESTQKGNQRKRDKNRLREIAQYIDSVEMAFPNSIILAANYTQEGKVLEDLEETENSDIAALRWYIEETDLADIYKIIIPTELKLASIVDGQHRVLAFDELSEYSPNAAIDLPCAIFFDLPNAYQAFLFATINGNQKKVDRSLALEQFGFNVEEEAPKSWTPEKLAVFLSRKLNNKPGPLYRRIKIAPRDPYRKFENKPDWFVSMATVVDGILALISTKPKLDRVLMAQERILKGRDRNMVDSTAVKDSSPLRSWFLNYKDDQIYNTVRSFFLQVDNSLWQSAPTGSYIVKTVGVLALFDLLKRILQDSQVKQYIESVHQRFSKDDPLLEEELKVIFGKYVQAVQHVDFNDFFFQASGVGRARIRNLLLMANGFDVRASDIVKVEIRRLLQTTI